MKRITYLTLAMVAVPFCSQAWLGTGAPAQAATVTDTFALKATVTARCEGNPKFVETFNVKVAEGVTFTITRDVNGNNEFTDIQATLNGTTNADLDAIIMKGLSFQKNASHSKEALVLSGVNPGNTDHFFTILGKATFDPAPSPGNPGGNLTKVTGTFVDQITDTYSLAGGGESGPVECFSSGTFETKNKLVP
jgi:hypothetical protein